MNPRDRFAAASANKPIAESDAASVKTYVPQLPCVRSEDLFGKVREIVIEHCGAYYHLRLTKANKLILTK
jgi:hemin uptake protein HemP